MAKDKFNGFEVDNLDFVDTLRTNPIGVSSSDSFDESHEVNEETEENIDDILTQIKKSAGQETEENKTEEVEEPVFKPKTEEENQNETENTSDEVDQVSLFWDAFTEYNNIDKDDEAPETVESLFDKINKITEEKSVPKYGNNIIEEMDKFVKNGGDINEYFSIKQTSVDIENMDLDDVDNQKKVLTEFLSRKGFNAQQISKKIERYQDSDMLEDESKEAYDSLKDILEAEKQSLLERQENLHQEQVQAQQAFYTNVVDEIEGISDIRGIKIPEKDKKELMQYIFKVESDGTTRYQKDYNKSVKNLIESAYFTMKGDILIDNAKKTGESTAIKKFKNSLSSKKINKSSGRQDFKDDDLFSLLSSQLRN